MDQVIKLEKTYQQRLQEYREIFTGNAPFSLSKIKQEFSFYLELLVERSGWQAIWKISRPACEDFGIDFPTVVLVFIENMDLEKLKAAVKIMAVLDDIHLPEMHIVSLMELWPIRQHDGTVVWNTANALDVVRFFYVNLYMPWDDDEDDGTKDWVEEHLERRLQLYYDLKNGIIPRSVAEHLRSLLTTARRLKQQIEKEVEEEKLVELQVSLLEIQKEVELFENPLARKVLIKRAENPEDSIGGKCWFICDSGLAEEYLKFIDEAKEKLAGKKIRFASIISDALGAGASGDLFILRRGKHEFDNMGALEGGGTLISICGREETKLVSLNNIVMLDFSADALLENLTIISSAQCAILVRNGKLTIKNCRIIADNYSRTQQGVTVLSGAAVEFKNCSLSGFHIAVVGNTNSSISVENCEISEVNYGLKLYDRCAIKLQNTTVCGSRQYGIWIETEQKAQNNRQQLFGGFQILKELITCEVDNLQGKDNRNGDVIINYREVDIIDETM